MKCPFVERENVIYDLWKSGRYGSKKDLAKRLGYDITDKETRVSDLIRAKEDRIRLKVGSAPTSNMILLKSSVKIKA